MTGTPLIFGERERASLEALRELAAAHPVDMTGINERLATAPGKRAHMDQMNEQTVVIPVGFLVTFSVERGHPCGTCRHMSMSSPAKGRAPTPEAVWAIAEALGFAGGLEACTVYLEELQRGDGRTDAVNVVQPVRVAPAERA